ncbi:hypothetical protein GCM10010495_74220 [Kitasatospora herbaricolor]|uniref:hypothetical protein n=1 Tax=Kitasatospora herbaricolor TaxID=68217 RepID=UPI00174C875C|nr:hypothetical protein [Kitasatospora herbaricolor]MDQ0305474.1 hypothetical protein [Kitasatospora herbaricolor]GGV45760.1 hypothetical protein GCM10010495_74220 [Kitasatospora herbaricolor]
MGPAYVPPGQHPAVWVTEGLPGPLLAALVRHGGIPHTVRTLVIDQLKHRGPEDLRLRAERRWFQRYSHLTGPEIAERADRLAYDLLAPSGCEVAQCEDGWLLDDSGGCHRCRIRRTVVDTTLAEPSGGPRSSPEYVTDVVAAMRAQRRRTHGTPRSTRSIPLARGRRPYEPAPGAMREAEPDHSAAEPIERARRLEHDREVQRLAEQKAKADKAARATEKGNQS